jgi:predicted enzyme related to lactoylglutathione lyase
VRRAVTQVTWMANMLDVIYFEICVDDLESAATFYSNVFDWDIKPSGNGSEYRSIGLSEEGDKGVSGGLSTRFDEQNSTINTIEVPSLDIYAKKIAENEARCSRRKSQYREILRASTYIRADPAPHGASPLPPQLPRAGKPDLPTLAAGDPGTPEAAA